MTRQTPPTLDWRGDRWRPATGRLIEKRLRRHKDRLAEMLSIDLAEQEARRIPAAYPPPDGRTVGERYVAWRNSSPDGGEMVSWIDLAIEEIAAALRRCWALHRDVNRAGSSARVRRTLEVLLDGPDRLTDRWQTCDPETRGLIEAFYPGGWLAMEAGIDPGLLIKTAEEALASLPLPRRGRPAGHEDHAGQYLGPALAEIYTSHAGRLPGRRSRQVPTSENAPLQSEEYGPYKDFVEVVISVIPARLRRTKTGATKSVDSLVRLGVDHVAGRT